MERRKGGGGISMTHVFHKIAKSTNIVKWLSREKLRSVDRTGLKEGRGWVPHSMRCVESMPRPTTTACRVQRLEASERVRGGRWRYETAREAAGSVQHYFHPLPPSLRPGVTLFTSCKPFTLPSHFDLFAFACFPSHPCIYSVTL